MTNYHHGVCLAGIRLPEGQMSHVLRNSFAGHFMMAERNIIVLQPILGHSDIRVTMRDDHFPSHHLEDAIHCNPLTLMAKKNGNKVASQAPAE